MIDIRSTSVLGALYSRGLEHKNGPGKFTIRSGFTTTAITIDTRTYLAAAGNFRMPQVHLGGFRKIIFVAQYLTESCMGDAAGSSSQVTWEFGTSRAQSFIRRVVAGRRATFLGAGSFLAMRVERSPVRLCRTRPSHYLLLIPTTPFSLWRYLNFSACKLRRVNESPFFVHTSFHCQELCRVRIHSPT